MCPNSPVKILSRRSYTFLKNEKKQLFNNREFYHMLVYSGGFRQTIRIFTSFFFVTLTAISNKVPELLFIYPELSYLFNFDNRNFLFLI